MNASNAGSHCDAQGRDYNTIRKTAVYPGPVPDDPTAFVIDAKRYAALGISQLDLISDPNVVKYTERLAEIVPYLANL